MTDNSSPQAGITDRLLDWSDNPQGESAEALFRLVYDELHRQAHRYLRKERGGHTLQTTALVNEAYLKLRNQKIVSWENRSHFFGMAATMMRRILIDYAKTKRRVRRGGAAQDLPLERAMTITVSEMDLDLLALDEALDRLATKEQHLARLVELRFFSGLDVVETADVLGISESTVKRDWQMARAWLHRELTKRSSTK